MRLMSLEELMTGLLVPEIILEDLTYDQLFRMSEPKRFQRSLTVKMPPLDMQQYQTGRHWVFEYYFNAKGNPSTTGLRHRGYVRFKKPKKTHTGKNTPLSKLAVEVDCMCPDYRYRWAWANHQRQAGPIGASSLNQCINKAPRKTNPSGAPGLCKHILATRDYIYGLLSGFPSWVGDEQKLNDLTKKATRRWLNFDQEMEKARERDAQIALAKARRNIGLPPEQQNRPIAAISAEEPPDLPDEKPSTALKPKKPAVKQSAKPITGLSTSPSGELSPEQFLGRRFMKVESVDITTNMKTLNLQEAKVVRNALKLVEEMETDIQTSEETSFDDMPPPSGGDMPVEPPISDTAVGASTEDSVALSLLREIRDLLAQLTAEEAAEGGEIPDLPTEEGDLDSDTSLEAESEEDEEFKPGKLPSPVTSGAE